MKMYTNSEQTAKLIELGFEKPNVIYLSYFDSPKDFKSTNVIEIDEDGNEIVLDNYSIGELIEALGYDLYSIHYIGLAWEVKSERVGTRENELIDALYKMILKLKEEGVI